ncbi:MAG: BlaI/MecI/CopY family transcriptional regulator [Lewinellaceae bacterium]|nr:BlaI/MecI/CopY family transcriptional regulator [Saprospiraceae bacterium]MCB9331060.1 BlaI/MecI/CopY family transcriptional regulator [Lewinellaceae bacterium]
MAISKPTESELEVLQILWESGPSTVRQVNDHLNDPQTTARSSRRSTGTPREVGYTTTLKIMQIMFEKGLVSRDEDGRTHIYTAAVSEQDTQSALLQQFVDATYRGSAMKLVMQALGNHDASPAEIDEIKTLLAQLEQNQSNDDA